MYYVINLNKIDGIVTITTDAGTLPPHPWQLSLSLSLPPHRCALIYFFLDKIECLLSAIADVDTES